jgi:hypothetical protein
MLLIDDREPQSGELHLVLEQGVGADHQLGRPAGDRRQSLGTRLLVLAAGKPRHFQVERRQPRLHLAVMLFRQDLGRGHDGGLPTVLDRL